MDSDLTSRRSLELWLLVFLVLVGLVWLSVHEVLCSHKCPRLRSQFDLEGCHCADPSVWRDPNAPK